MLPVLLLIILGEVETLRTAQLKGNLVFETEQLSSVTINPHYIQFNRQFDLTNIYNAILLLTNYTDSYEQYCNEIQKDRKRVYDMFQIKSMYYKAATDCRNNFGYLPEIKTEAEADRLVELMKLIDVKETPAGLTISNRNLIYQRSHKNNTYHHYKFCLQCQTVSAFLPPADKNRKIMVYAYDDDNQLHIRESACYVDKCNETTYICTKGSEFDDSVLTLLATHSCIRDTASMKETNKFLMQEYEGFVDATNTNLKRRKRFAPPHRRKRSLAPLSRNKRMIPAIPLMVGGMLGGGIMSSAMGTLNPFTFVGEVVGGIFGLATARELKMTQEMIKQVSNELDKVKVNQVQMAEAMNAMMVHAGRLEKLLRFQTHDTAVIYGEIDGKIAMRHLQSTIQLTLLKVHASMVSARQYKPSPYVFGQKDLRALAADQRYFKHKLTTNLEEVATALVVVNNKFTFLIAVPIKEDKSNYQTYRIHQLPIFNNNKTYKAILSNEYYAININTHEYIPLTDSDYSECSMRPLCATQAPIYTITSKSPCEISSFIFSKQTCPLEIAPPAVPSFRNYANTTFYSVPSPLQVNVRCSINGRVLSKHEKIDGIGSFQTHTGCITQITEQAQIRPIHVAEIHDLDSNSVFGVLNQFDFSAIQYPKEPDQETTTMRPITLLEVSSFSEGLNLLFDVKTTSTDVARVFLVIAILFIFFLSLYACIPSFKLWFNDCCSITKPHKYWGRKYMNVPQFVKIQQTNTIKERIMHYINRFRNIFTRTSQNQTNQSNNANIFHEFQDNHLYPNLNAHNV